MRAPSLDALADRLRTLLSDREVREVRMFGSLCFLVDGAIAVAANGDGGLLVRVARATDADLLREPDASRAAMEAGRSMGPGWIRVDAAGVRDDDDLRAWVGRALDGRG